MLLLLSNAHSSYKKRFIDISSLSRLQTYSSRLYNCIKDKREALVEILLVDVIGFKGDANAMACKLEHAIDEELEVTLDNMLGYPERSISGNKIPLVDRKMEILQNNLLPLNCLPNNIEATVELIAMNESEKNAWKELV